MKSSPATRLTLLILGTVLCYFSLYGPQPLLPLYRHDFHIGIQGAAALITVSFAFLASAPLAYGVLLEAWPPRRVLQTALVVTALGCLAFAAAQNYGWLLAARTLQSAALPAAITTIMTLISAGSRQDRIQMAMSIYIASTIAGGFLGRLTSGAVAEFTDWRIFFLAVGIAMLGLVAAIWRLPPAKAAPQRERPTPRLIGTVLTNPDARTAYITIFCVFFTFTTLLSFLPFRLEQLAGHASPLQAGYMYTGYVMGIVTALAARRITRVLGGNRRAIILAGVCYVACTAALAIPHTGIIFTVMFPFCGAMFLIHSLAVGHVNERATRLRGLTNGLYVASYYLGGIMGSYLPGLLYQSMGWQALIGLACATAVAAGFFASRIAWRD